MSGHLRGAGRGAAGSTITILRARKWKKAANRPACGKGQVRNIPCPIGLSVSGAARQTVSQLPKE